MKTKAQTHKQFRCPTCGRTYKSPIGVYSASCAGDPKRPPHKPTEMKPVKEEAHA